MSSSWLKKRFNHIRRLGGFGKKKSKATDDDTPKSDRCSDQHSETAGRLADELPTIKEEANTSHMVDISIGTQLKDDVRIESIDDQWAVEPKIHSHQLTKAKPPPKFASKLRQPLHDKSESSNIHNYF